MYVHSTLLFSLLTGELHDPVVFASFEGGDANVTITEINLLDAEGGVVAGPGNTSLFSVEENRYMGTFLSATLNSNPVWVQLVGTDEDGFNFTHFSEFPVSFTRFELIPDSFELQRPNGKHFRHHNYLLSAIAT